MDGSVALLHSEPVLMSMLLVTTGVVWKSGGGPTPGVVLGLVTTM